jgi:hypothetical protein
VISEDALVVSEDEAVSENAAVWDKEWARNRQGLSPIVLGEVSESARSTVWWQATITRASSYICLVVDPIKLSFKNSLLTASFKLALQVPPPHRRLLNNRQ